MRGTHDSEPRTGNRPQNRDSRMPSTPQLALHSAGQSCQATNYEASTGQLRNLEDTQQSRTFCSSDHRPRFSSAEQTCKFKLPQAPRLPSPRNSRHQSTETDPPVRSTYDPAERQETWTSSASNNQKNDGPVMPKHVHAGSSPIPFPRKDLAINLSAIACSPCIHPGICYPGPRLCRDLAANKCRTSTLVGAPQCSVKPLEPSTLSSNCHQRPGDDPRSSQSHKPRPFHPWNGTCLKTFDYPRDGENFLGFTNIADILGIGEKGLSDELYQAAEPFLSNTSEAARLATNLIYLKPATRPL